MPLWLLFFALLLAGCAGGNGRMPWQVPSSENFSLYPIVHDGKAVLSSQCGGLDCLRCVDLETGETIWEWPDITGILPKSYYNLTPYFFENTLLLPIANELIAIDLRNGQTRWQDARPYPGESHLGGLGGQAVRTYSDQAAGLHRVFLIDVKTGDMREVKRFAKPENAQLFVRTPHLAQLESPARTTCTASLIEYVPKTTTRSYLASWNLTDSSALLEIPIYPDNPNGDGVTQQGISEGRHSYWVANDEVACLDLLTLTEKWRTKLPAGMLTSRLLRHNSLLLFSCENETLYAVDQLTGEIAWKAPAAGTTSRVFVENGVVHLVGGSDGQLHLFDVASGKKLGTEKLPGHDFAQGHFLRRTCFAGRGSLILNDGSDWLCYPIKSDGLFSFGKNQPQN